MPCLLVSVRDAGEAEVAVDAGATIIDVKEPRRGPLGRADSAVWDAVIDRVPPWITVSVALGELREWSGRSLAHHPISERVRFLKVGLSQAGPSWVEEWRELDRRLTAGRGERRRWVAVIYRDWRAAAAPSPGEVVEAAIAEGFSGLLVDTWDKPGPGWTDLATWADLLERARAGGLFVALAGGLDAEGIIRLSNLRPDIFAVRSAACAGGDRNGPIEGARVRELASLAAGHDGA